MKTMERLETNDPEERQEFLPNSPEEKELWEELENADKPIVNILKRLNRVISDKFPKSGIRSAESCSGHVQKDGSLAYMPTLPERVGKVPKREKNALIILEAPAKNVSPKQRGQIEQSLGAFFEGAVDSTNKQLGVDSISLDNTTKSEAQEIYSASSNKPFKGYIFVFRFPLSEKENAYDVLRTFWGKVEDELTKTDGIEKRTESKMEDFLEGEPRSGWENV